MKRMMLAAPLALMLVACGGGDPEAEADEVIEEVGALDENSRFVQALDAAGMKALLDGPEPYTILMPADAAFADDLSEDPETLAPILSQHMLPGTILAEDIVAALEASEDGAVQLPSYGGEDVTVRRDGETLVASVGGTEARLVADGEERFDHGVVHRIDSLLASAQ